MSYLNLSNFFLIFLIFIVAGLIKYYLKLCLFSFKLQGPRVLPLIGNGLEFLIGKKDDFLKILLKSIGSYTSPTRLWFGPKLVIIVKDADQLQTILQSSKITNKGFIYNFVRPIVGNGLVTSADPTHKIHRKLFQPFFSQRLIEGYAHLFQKHANKLVKQLRKHCEGSEFDIISYLHYSGIESIMDILVEDKNDHTINYKKIAYAVQRFQDIVITRLRHFWLHPDFLFKFTSYFKEQSRIQETVMTLLQDILKTRVPEIVERLKNGGRTEKDARAFSVLEKICEIVVENPESHTLEEFIDHILTFISASLDTQSSAIAFTCLMLAAYPEKQKQVVQELKEVLGDRTTIDFTDASKLKYLEMCIKESMRLFPPAPYVFRETAEDFQLGELIIPENVTVVLGLYNVHKDSKHWEQPDDFFPDHFLPEAVSKRHPFAFLPFSAGPRNCIAQLYSYINMKIIIANILLNFELESSRKVNDIELALEILIRPIGGYMVKLKKRAF